MANYQFTPDDLMQPVYCTQCRVHIPKAISNANKGACDDCLNRTLATPPIAPAMQGPIDTRCGICSLCGSRNISQSQIVEATQAQRNMPAWIILSIVCSCGLGLLFLLYGALQGHTKVIGWFRHCNACGHQWRM